MCRHRMRVAIVVAAWAGLHGPPSAAEQHRRDIAFAGTSRSYILFQPDRPAAGAALPLVIALHGGGGTAAQLRRFSRFDAVAAREGFAVVYPNGMARRWNDGRIFDGRGETAADDVGFIRVVVADVARQVRIDPRRIFAAGISNGGFMSFRLACEAADLVAAIAAVTATMPADLGPSCRPSAPVSVLVVNGTADPLVPYQGGQVRTVFGTRGAIWSTDRTLSFWAGRAGCGATPSVRVLPDRYPSDSSRAVAVRWTGCAGVGVQLLRIEGGGHTWPGGAQYLPQRWIGPTNRDIEATDAIWRFFETAPAR